MSLQEFHLARAESKRKDIINAASRLFAAKGFNRVTTATLASEAGVSSATLYKYFKDKESLFGAVVDSLITQHIPNLANRAKTNSPNSLEELCHAYAELFQDETVIGILRAVIADTKNMAGFRDKLDDHGSAIFATEFEREIKALLLEHNPSELFDLEQASLELKGMIENQVMLSLLFHDQQSPAEYRSRVARCLSSWSRHWLGTQA